MSNPKRGVIGGYATIEQARAAWANIIDNDKLIIYDVNLGFSEFKPADTAVCYIILNDLQNDTK